MAVVERTDSRGRKRFHARVYRGARSYKYGPTRDSREEAAQDERRIEERVERRQAAKRQPKEPGDHWLYRCYDAGGDLLYVGITTDGFKRFRRHGNDKDWWPQLARIEVEHHESAPAVLAAEQETIRELRPKFNTNHRVAEQQPEAVVEMYRQCRKCKRHYRASAGCDCPGSTVARDRQMEALRREGMSYEEIAERFGLARTTAMHLVSKFRRGPYYS